MEVVRGTPMQVIVHVGSNCLEDARTLANQAEQLGAFAISAVAPNYFKPRDVAALVECAAHIASAAPKTAFYWYDIPSFTHLNHSMPEFLAQAGGRIPTLAGVKFSNSDLMAFQLCLHAPGGPWTIPFGIDEFLLAALALGATSAVGSTYNVAAPIYTRLIAAFQRGDLAAARAEQLRSARLVQVLASYGFMSAMKALMGMLGVDVGPARLPHTPLTPERLAKLRAELEALGFFAWVQP
jgi:N-acetylneuraminate lyase